MIWVNEFSMGPDYFSKLVQILIISYKNISKSFPTLSSGVGGAH
jgi:hypothetical protein